MQSNHTSSTQPTTNRVFIPLEAIHVASPCHADWNKMTGDEQARFCGSCARHVYNLSEMTRDEAEALIAEKEGKLCVRYYQREDGTILTTDCNVGAAAKMMSVRRTRAARVLTMAFCALGALLPNAVRANAAGLVDSMRSAPLIGSVVNLVSPPATAGVPVPPPKPPKQGEIMGDIGPAPTPAPKPRMSRSAAPQPAETPAPLMGIVAIPRPPKTPPKKPQKIAKPKVRVLNATRGKKVVTKKPKIVKTKTVRP